MSNTSNVARIKGQPSVRDRVSAAEWEARVELAAAHRYAEYSGWTDLIFNHFTLRVPGEPNCFLVKQHELMFEEVTASNLLKVRMDGEPVGTDEHVNAAAYTIHTAVFEVRPDVNAVAHIHSPAGMVLAAHAHGLRYLCQDAMMFYNRVGYHDFEGIAVDLEERKRLGRNLGQHRAMVLRNHGLLTCGATVREAWDLMYYLERACQAQIAAMAGGAELNIPPPAVAEKVARVFLRPSRPASQRDWPALLRMLERRGVRYAD